MPGHRPGGNPCSSGAIPRSRGALAPAECHMTEPTVQIRGPVWWPAEDTAGEPGPAIESGARGSPEGKPGAWGLALDPPCDLTAHADRRNARGKLAAGWRGLKAAA